MSLPPFVASGYRSSLTHATWEGRQIEKGDVVAIELSGCVKRYSAALYRTATVGEPSDKIKEMERVALDTLNATIEAIKPGVTAELVYEAARKALAKHGAQLKKRIGYSIGINFPPDWGEGHALSLVVGERTVLQPGMVFHTPCVSREFGLANVAISETTLVTEDGHETLSSLPREFPVT
jgi:Xaa-Pro dipeptidase